MTRGQIVLITDKRLYTSIEFNGNMYLDEDCGGYGQEVIESLKNITSYNEYCEFVNQFNEEHFGYEDEPIVFFVATECGTESMLDMTSGNYFDKWFSDYLYIKSIRDEDILIVDKNGKQITLQKGDIVALDFGEFTDKCEAFSIVTNITIKTLEERVIELCEEQGWRVNVYEQDIELFQQSPLGEDFGFSVGRQDIVRNIIEYCTNFDIDEHAEMWVMCRGKNGVPSSISALVKDATDISDMLEELALKINKIARN